MTTIPDPEYLKTDDGALIAYHVVGHGPVDIAWQLDFIGNLDFWWEAHETGAWFEGLASFSRLILHDPRGQGLSSRNVAIPNLETRAADLVRVLDEVGAKRPVVGGWFESMSPAILLAASEPSRVESLIWWNPTPRTRTAADYEWGDGPEEVARERKMLERWGTVEYGRYWAESFTRDWGGVEFTDFERAAHEMARHSRNACTPDVALALNEAWWATDVRAILPTVSVPTLIIVSGEDKALAASEHVAQLLPHAQLVRAPIIGSAATREEAMLYVSSALAAIQRFIGIEPTPVATDTVLASVLFTDIVGSTQRQAQIGDRGWKVLVERHNSIARASLREWRGVENDTAGDGFYATFDGPARAIRCGLEISDRVRDLGIEIRAGVHTGECEIVDGKTSGIAVSIGARIAAMAGPSQVLVSRTVKDLVAGSGFVFDSLGEHDLKGIPDRWNIFSVMDGDS